MKPDKKLFPFKHSYIFKYFFSAFLSTIFFLLPAELLAQRTTKQLAAEELKKLSVEQLMNIEVTSVSRMPEKLSQAASAVQVITQDDIKHSAATNLPEALRLASNLQVTQLNARHWVISARGFNANFSNKLLVMIDGRTVYSPLFAGVFWDAQDVLLEDIDRIEVISGPGGALWGANAVNGVINIITKNAKETKGWLASGAIGSFLQDEIQLRYGGAIGSKISYRVYTHYFDRNNTVLPNGKDNSDNWRFSQSGFVLDWDAAKKDALNFQGNFYAGRDSKNGTPSSIDGQNIMGKWTHTFSSRSDIVFRAYFDRTWRIDIPSTINDQLVTCDFDLQHHFPIGKKHDFLWGAEYRFINDHTDHATENVAILPVHRNLHVFSSFVQDEITVLPDRFKVTLGTKLENNSFSGLEILPSVRLALMPYKQHLLWGAVSRAIRAPSRFDVDYYLPAFPVPPTSPGVAGGPNFKSEKLMAYELGYRLQYASKLSLSAALFYNKYNDLYSVEPLPGTLTYQIQNGATGFSNGFELNGNYQVTTNWRLRGGYTYFFKKLKNKPGNVTDPVSLKNLGSDAKNHLLVQSILDLPEHLNFDVVARYISSLPSTQFITSVPSYFILDVKISWQFNKQFEASIAGQNLLEKQHAETGAIGGGIEIPRGIYGRITWRYKK